MGWADHLRSVRRLVRPIEAAEVRWFGRSGISLLARTPAGIEIIRAGTVTWL